MRCVAHRDISDSQRHLLTYIQVEAAAQENIITFSQREAFAQQMHEYCDIINGVRFNSYDTFIENPPTGGPGEASLSLASRFDLLGSSGVLQGFDYIEYPPFEDAPQEGDYSLLDSLFKALVVVAVIAVVAIVGVATGGIGLGLGLAVIGGAAVFSGCVVYNDYQNGNASSWKKYIGAALVGVVVGAAIYAFAVFTVKLIPYVAKGLESIAIVKGIPFLQIYATKIATAVGYTLAITNSVRITNFLVSGVTGQENALVNIFFEEGSAAYNNAINVYNGIASFLNFVNAAYFTIGIAAYVLEKIANKSIGNPVAIEGRGSTGRSEPNNLNEQMAKHEVMSDPLTHANRLPLKLGDPRWPHSDGWVKMQKSVILSDGSKITMHYVYNIITKVFDDFKFV